VSAQKIFTQISHVMTEIDAIGKDRDNRAQGFKFRGIDDVYNALHEKLAKAKIFTVPEVLEERREERPTKSGGISTHVILKMKYTLYADDGSNISGVVIGEGADHGDKATNKAMAIAHKYFFLQTFCIPTEDAKDPDAETTEFVPRDAAKPAPKVAPKAAAKTATPATKPDPWQTRIPRGWKQNGGKTLEELGADGTLKLLEWLERQPNLSRDAAILKDACMECIGSRSMREETDPWPNEVTQ
jgi:hypothetical protein